MSERGEALEASKPNVRELRKNRRKRSLLPATLVTEAGTSECSVLDLSRGGARIASPVTVADEQAVTLIIKPIGTFAGLVAWRGHGSFGIKFLAQHGAAAASPVAHSDDAPGMPKGEDSQHKLRQPPPERAIGLRRGDVICLLRKKSRASEGESKPSASCRRRETLRIEDAANFKLVDLDPKKFMALLERRSAFSIVLMRVASGGARKRGIAENANASEPRQLRLLDLDVRRSAHPPTAAAV